MRRVRFFNHAIQEKWNFRCHISGSNYPNWMIQSQILKKIMSTHQTISKQIKTLMTIFLPEKKNPSMSTASLMMNIHMRTFS